MSSFGRLFRVHTYGESHCASVGCIVDGVPPGLSLTEDEVQVQLARRRPGQSSLTTPRNEQDQVQIQSGVENGVTLGTPVSMLVRNKDQRPHDYSEMDSYPRPSHADYTYLVKYGVKASSGGGRSSARETIGRVAAGAVAEKVLRLAYGVEIVAFVSSVGKTSVPDNDPSDPDLPPTPEYLEKIASLSRADVDKSKLRCPFPDVEAAMEQTILDAKSKNDSIGGTVTCIIKNVPAGLGEPSFDKLEALLAHAMLSIPATKGFEIGSGFRGTMLNGSKHNDSFVAKPDGSLGTSTNYSAGIQGGISNGEHIYFKVAFKPAATISMSQDTAQYDGTSGSLASKGRHDPAVVPRAVPIVEAMSSLVLMDCALEQNARASLVARLPQPSGLPLAMNPLKN